MGRRTGHSGRDGGKFLALPDVMLLSPAYRSLNQVGRALLVDIAMQFNGKNNGRLVATWPYLNPLGWNSKSQIKNYLDVLLERGLLIETRKGGRNWPAWYATTWQKLDVLEGIDIAPRSFPRGAYIRYAPAPSQGARPQNNNLRQGAQPK